ncbi:MAG: formylglycine-generating enzyme family protein [Planctomycetota bacterium]
MRIEHGTKVWAMTAIGIFLFWASAEAVPAFALQETENPKKVTNSIGMNLIFVPRGTFEMGSARGDRGADLDERQHRVTLSRDYYLGAFECTQAEYEKVMGRNPSQFQGNRIAGSSSNHPVEQISWEDAVEFCRRLSELPEEKAAGRVYRLPTEAEWEYGCRAGNLAVFAFGDQDRLLDEYGWYKANGNLQTHPVGQKKPNAWGLYDMHGNAWEWCADWYGNYPNRAVVDPRGPEVGTDRVYRGGSWNYDPDYERSANRTGTRPDFKGFDFLSIGFRVAVDAPAGK